MQDVVFHKERTRRFPVPNKVDQEFEIDVWVRVKETEDLNALAIVQNLYPLPADKRLAKVSSVLRHGNLILACTQYPFVEAGDDAAELSGRMLGAFLVDDVDYYPPEEGFRQAAKLNFNKACGSNPDVESSGYRRRRRHWEKDNDFHISFVTYKAGRNYTQKDSVRQQPICKEHLRHFCRHITDPLPGTLKIYEAWDNIHFVNQIEKHIAAFVRLFGKNGYRDSGAFLALLTRYLKTPKASRNKIGDEMANWLETEARSRVVKKLLKKAEKELGANWVNELSHKYKDAVIHNSEPSPIQVAHNAVTKKFYEEQDRKLKEQQKQLEIQEAKDARDKSESVADGGTTKRVRKKGGSKQKVH